jgi:hypothetical protein
MNALLQHRGHNLMGAGRSIAVQNFNEQACIFGLGALYVCVTRLPEFLANLFGEWSKLDLTLGGQISALHLSDALVRAESWLDQHGANSSVYLAISMLGLLVAGTMWRIRRWHEYNCVNHREEVDHLLVLARSDRH